MKDSAIEKTKTFWEHLLKIPETVKTWLGSALEFFIYAGFICSALMFLLGLIGMTTDMMNYHTARRYLINGLILFLFVSFFYATN